MKNDPWIRNSQGGISCGEFEGEEVTRGGGKVALQLRFLRRTEPPAMELVQIAIEPEDAIRIAQRLLDAAQAAKLPGVRH